MQREWCSDPMLTYHVDTDLTSGEQQDTRDLRVFHPWESANIFCKGSDILGFAGRIVHVTT